MGVGRRRDENLGGGWRWGQHCCCVRWCPFGRNCLFLFYFFFFLLSYLGFSRVVAVVVVVMRMYGCADIKAVVRC